MLLLLQLKSQVSQKAKHAKIYKSGIRPVTSDLYDCQQTDGLHQYSSRTIQDRTGKMGWPKGILSITIIPGEDGK